MISFPDLVLSSLILLASTARRPIPSARRPDDILDSFGLGPFWTMYQHTGLPDPFTLACPIRQGNNMSAREEAQSDATRGAVSLPPHSHPPSV